MTSKQLREAFLDFFKSKGHGLVPSAPLVIKNDPTLMFTNAGMNQFKDIFLGNAKPGHRRVTNTQKCLRVSGKHNDLEEVGHDTYHHTMFEMLGNWSFGDYFKEEAIDWAWEFLTKELNIDSVRIYATIFEGDERDLVGLDREALEFWRKHLPDNRILQGNKKDNFWEMGDTGPCGPCSEIHIDLRSDEERKKKDGSELVNQDHPLVIEIWNLVFIQYDRKADGSLTALPDKHVDTGMGFERLCMVVQGKKSNYDTDIFQSLISKIAELTGHDYGENEQGDIALRVIADHLRAVSFSIADGQIPSNNKAGYVIRRILRRAIRYGYTFLEQRDPFIYKLVPVLVQIMGESFPELEAQQNLIENVIREEEQSFLQTLDKGIGLLDRIIQEAKAENNSLISGSIAFELYDTYGFPLDLTQLILRENGLKVNIGEFEEEMKKQKSRSRQDAQKSKEDWIHVHDVPENQFVGYDALSADIHISRYRKIEEKGKELYQYIFDQSPFYPESGGQVGDTGYIADEDQKIPIISTLKENELIIHISPKLTDNPEKKFHAVVNGGVRINTANNHTATHLLHYALREVLGKHVEQKGSLVHPDYLRFDFSHYEKLSEDTIRQIEEIVNGKIRENIPLEENREMVMEEARKIGAMALFGEKYGEKVRVIRFGDSVELCGGTHVNATGQIGFFKITKETAIAAGIRRIEAMTGIRCQQYLFQQLDNLQAIEELFPASKDTFESVKNLKDENLTLTKKLENIEKEKLGSLIKNLRQKKRWINGINFIGEILPVEKANDLRNIAFQLNAEIEDLFMILGAEVNGKANMALMISEELVNKKNINASVLIRDFAKEISGGGGGQSFFATAGGKNPEGLQEAINKAKEYAERI